MSETKWPASQVHAVGAPAPKSWDDYENGCMMTYRGGHHDEPEVGCFRHGMGTVFNLLRHEFPPAPVCKAAPDMLAALKAAWDYIDDIAPLDGNGPGSAVAVLNQIVKAIEKAEQR